MSDLTWERAEDEVLIERYELMKERISQIPGERAGAKYGEFFSSRALFLLKVIQVYEQGKAGALENRSLEECVSLQDELYGEVMPGSYAESFANPRFSVSKYGKQAGQLLTLIAAEMRKGIAYAFEGKLLELTILLELFVEVYNCFEMDDAGEAKAAVRSYFVDYSEIFTENQIREMIDPDYDFYTNILMNADLADERYLYRYGLPISSNETGISRFLNTLSEDEIQAMADTYTEGYRIGFVMKGVDLSKKETVEIVYPVGFERMMRAAVKNFEKMGLRAATGVLRGVYSTPVNRQYSFDHRESPALYFDKGFVERRLEVFKTVFEHHKEQAAVYAGPAVVEVFGEAPFAPEAKEEAIHYDDKQQKEVVRYTSGRGQISNEYIKGEERSFTIIAYPLPEIGDSFEEIFAETVAVNTLDYVKYQQMQQCIIDVLNGAEKVHVLGKGINRTDLTVSIWPVKDTDKEASFENCVADVNIPVGEVFTSPVLKGTNGVLHVSEVFLNGLRFLDLELVFKDGMIESYSCSNFEDEAENKKYIRDNILMHHETLPIGEFAIGTNTTAYRMAKKYQIFDKLPILIAEKTGPHFAVGDTCYSHDEEVTLRNPDGKLIVAKENEVSALRKTDPSKAYFNCHTDITIPYEELGSITAIRNDGSRSDIIRDGFFTVSGAEDLNIPLRDIISGE